MPELPEVETVVRDLRPLVVGRTVRGVRSSGQALRKPWHPAWDAAVSGCRIDGVSRRGKWIVLELVAADGGRPRLVVHLGMTGQFTAVSAAVPRPDHLHLVFEFDDGTELRFRDTRRFGSATYFPDAAAVEAFFAANGLGPEPFGLDPAAFRDAVRGTDRCLKAILLDQTVVAGVGNIYADEACFRAGLHPGVRGSRLSPADADRLRAAIEAVLTKAIESRGSTIRDYVGGSGLRGGFQNEFAVYGRTGLPCPACGTAIEVTRLAGRSSHYCSSCQRSAVSRQPNRKTKAAKPKSPRKPSAAG